MMTSRHIGYQEKKKKQSTAPIRNPCADALRLALRPRLAAARERARRGGVGSGVNGRAGRPCLWGGWQGRPGSSPGSAAVSQDLVDLAGRGGQQLGDVRV